MNDTYRAFWSRGQPGTLIVADPAGTVVASLQITRTFDGPSPLMLRDTEWSIYPGSSWAKDDDSPCGDLGEWSAAVFRSAQRRAGGDSRDGRRLV